MSLETRVGLFFGAPLQIVLATYLISLPNNILLPIVKWLIAKHPVPLSVNGIADSVISKHLVVEIVSVET